MIIQKSRVPLKEILFLGILPGFLKKLIYRLRGYRIGKNVSIGFGSVVCGNRVSIGNYTSIGFLTIIRGNEITIGSHVSIGSTTFLDTPHISIGDDSKINEQVFVGGLQWPNSRFVMGRNCQIMQMSFINPSVSITMGDFSGIGGHCLVFGHSSWNSMLEGYPVEFKPIEIGRDVSIAWHVFILPGSTVGDGSIVGPNSLLNRSIPEKCLAAGYPVRIIGKPPEFPRQMSEEEKIRALHDVEEKMVSYFRECGLSCESDNSGYRVMYRRNRFLFQIPATKRFLFLYDAQSVREAHHDEYLDAVVSYHALSNEARTSYAKGKTVWFDITRKERALYFNDLSEEIALFLRRYGIKFQRV